jgi:hypothetical protein
MGIVKAAYSLQLTARSQQSTLRPVQVLLQCCENDNIFLAQQSIFASLVDIISAKNVAFSWGKNHSDAWILYTAESKMLQP